MRETRRVRIPARPEHQGTASITINLFWDCPICGKPRGTIHNATSYDGSLRLQCHAWKNDCGHIDKYSALIPEAIANGLN